MELIMATIIVKSEAAKAAAIAAGLDLIKEVLPGTYRTQRETWWECTGEVDTVVLDDELSAVVGADRGDGVPVKLDQVRGVLWRQLPAGPDVPDHVRFTPLWTPMAIRQAFGGLREEEWVELLALDEAIEVAGVYDTRDVRRREWLMSYLSRPQREAFERWQSLRHIAFHPPLEVSHG